MLAQAARRIAAPAVRARTQVRTLMDHPNAVNQGQRDFQKGATPYLRGDADPTYLRKSSDGPITAAFMGAAILGWVLLGVNHYRLWNDKK